MEPNEIKRLIGEKVYMVKTDGTIIKGRIGNVEDDTVTVTNDDRSLWRIRLSISDIRLLAPYYIA